MKLSQVNKYLKNDTRFIENISTVDFKKGPSSVWFYRHRDQFLDVLAFWASGSGDFLDVPLVCFKTDLIEHCDMSAFPKGFIGGMPNITQKYVSKKESGISNIQSPWRISDEIELAATLEILAEQIVNKIDPWLREIKTDTDFFNSMPEFSREDGYGARIKSRLNLDL